MELIGQAVEPWPGVVDCNFVTHSVIKIQVRFVVLKKQFLSLSWHVATQVTSPEHHRLIIVYGHLLYFFLKLMVTCVSNMKLPVGQYLPFSIRFKLMLKTDLVQGYLVSSANACYCLILMCLLQCLVLVVPKNTDAYLFLAFLFKIKFLPMFSEMHNLQLKEF